ncbi:AbrB/MazE/SpoVT family DNA-binding domain-containing protein [Enterovibrio norvegicus]|nr:AbrB/MazE/SpoVT family DNA-binding domain-containing protein [Enterovibrio norvegicus]
MRVPVKTDNAGERFFEIPNELLEELGWQEGDELEWDKNDDGSYTLSKKHTSV